MPFERSEKQVREFYDRWKAPVFRFCVLFLGDKKRAADATGQAFLRYVKETPDAANNQLPHGLVRLALEAARQVCVTPDPLSRSGGVPLQEAILTLPCEQRAVFILRNVLGMDRRDVSEVTGHSLRQVSELWTRSMLTLREQLPKEFFKEQIR